MRLNERSPPLVLDIKMRLHHDLQSQVMDLLDHVDEDLVRWSAIFSFNIRQGLRVGEPARRHCNEIDSYLGQLFE